MTRSTTFSPSFASDSTGDAHAAKVASEGWLNGLEPFRGLIESPRVVASNEVLYCDGDECEFIYLIRSGTFKLNVAMPDGCERISGFRMSGDMLGLDGFDTNRYASSATAIESSSVCAVSRASLANHLSDREIQASFYRHMSAEIKRHSDLILALGSLSAEARLAGFLVSYSQRLAATGYSSREFHLRMTRADIASYLGLSMETVSRVFTAFQLANLLTVDRRYVGAIDLAGLNEVIRGG